MNDDVRDAPVVRAAPDFGAFYRREYRGVLGLAYVLCGNRSVAEELVQESFIAAFARWEEVGSMERPGAWVRRGLTNRAVSRYRRLAAEARALVRLRGHLPDTPEVSAESLDLWASVRRLTPRQAEAIVLTYYSGLSHEEAADVMGCTVETARTHLKRAKARLAKWLGHDR